MRKIIALLLLVPSGVCLAQGGTIVRIPDGTSTRCIDPAHDKVWITLRRLITTRSSGWFTKETSVAVIIKAKVTTQPGQGKAVEFPLMSEATFGDAPNGQVSLPIEYQVVSGLRLALPNEAYFDGVGIDLTLLNKRGKNRWGTALSTLKDVTKGLPIPATPLTQAASYLMDFANKAVDKDIADQANDDKVKSATLALNFDPKARCSGDFESTGTIAVIRAEGAAGQDRIPVGKTNDYCWAADLTPAFLVKAAKKDPTFKCGDAHYNPLFRQIANNYVGFFVNAVGASGTSGPKPAAVIRDEQMSVARCRANGFSRERCKM
jgi:hypothetical protein